MKLFTALIALAIAAPSYANDDPFALPAGVRVDKIDPALCHQIKETLANRNIYVLPKSVAYKLWYINSQGEYLAFKCPLYIKRRQWDPLLDKPEDQYGYVYVASKSVIDKYIADERAAHKQMIEENKRKVESSGYL